VPVTARGGANSRTAVAPAPASVLLPTFDDIKAAASFVTTQFLLSSCTTCTTNFALLPYCLCGFHQGGLFLLSSSDSNTSFTQIFCSKQDFLVRLLPLGETW